MAYKEVDQAYFNKQNEAAQQRKSGGGTWDSWKPSASAAGKPPAKNVIRFMPPHENMPDDGFVQVRMHFLPSATEKGQNGRPISIGVNCLKFFGEDCPACAAVNNLYEAAKTEDDAGEVKRLKEEAYSKGSKLRFFLNVVDMQAPEKGVQKYALGGGVEKKIRACFYDDEGDFRNIAHPKTGRDIIMMVTQKGDGFNEYVTVKAKDTPSPLPDMDWLKTITDLSELAKKPKLADIEMALRGERPGGSKAAPAQPPAAEKKKETTRAQVDEAQTKKPAAEAKTEEIKKSKRQPVTEDDASGNGSDPYAKARQIIKKSGIDFTPIEVTVDELPGIKKPVCYTKETELQDEACRGCRVLLPCLEAKTLAEE